MNGVGHCVFQTIGVSFGHALYGAGGTLPETGAQGQFGVTPEQLRERFDFYFEAYPAIAPR